MQRECEQENIAPAAKDSVNEAAECGQDTVHVAVIRPTAVASLCQAGQFYFCCCSERVFSLFFLCCFWHYVNPLTVKHTV